MREFFGPFVWPADQPQPSNLNWPLIGALGTLAAFWIVVTVLLVRAL